MLFAKVSSNGLFNMVQCGGKFGCEVTVEVGRVHYGNIRLIGTVGDDPAEAMGYIPSSGEVRNGDSVNVIGAGGPMGVMHVIRNICQGVEGITVYAGDLDDHRLELLSRIAEPLAKDRRVGYVPYNAANAASKKPDGGFSYTALMAPIPKLAAIAVEDSAQRAIVNIFAGIPAHIASTNFSRSRSIFSSSVERTAWLVRFCTLSRVSSLTYSSANTLQSSGSIS